MAGIIFAKFTVPRNRGETIVFSKNAVITMRNGALYMVRHFGRGILYGKAYSLGERES
jgi:hypothetical protein